MKRVTGILTTMLLLCFPAYSQGKSLTDRQTGQRSMEIEIYFDHGNCVIDSIHMSNGESMRELSNLIDAHSTDSNTEIIEIAIDSYTSPDGDSITNKMLSQNRSEAIHRYLTDELSIPDSLVTVANYGVAWSIMRERVVASELPYKMEIVEIIDNVPEETWGRIEPTDRWQSLVDSRNKHLMELKQGEPYRYMQTYIFPYLRKSSIEIRYVRKEREKEIEPKVEIVSDSICSIKPEVIAEVENTTIIEPSKEIAKTKKERLPRNPILAVKTNLVGLGMGVANIGVEVPIKRHFSIDGSTYYSPYTIDNEWRIRLSMLQYEVRYWLSTPLDKHFFGLHTHVGLFNVATNQWSRYQNDTDHPIWGLGLSYGYSLYLSRAWGLEFNIGAGYVSLRYDTFYNVENGAMYDYTERGYWGLTRACISLNYIINRK